MLFMDDPLSVYVMAPLKKSVILFICLFRYAGMSVHLQPYVHRAPTNIKQSNIMQGANICVEKLDIGYHNGTMSRLLCFVAYTTNVI